MAPARSIIVFVREKYGNEWNKPPVLSSSGEIRNFQVARSKKRRAFIPSQSYWRGAVAGTRARPGQEITPSPVRAIKNAKRTHKPVDEC